MTGRELQRMIKHAYQLPESERERRFLREHEKRTLPLAAVIRMESAYMGLRTIPAGMILCLLFMAAAKTEDSNLIWSIGALIPVCALLPMVLLSRSERYGMEELEAVCRFNLRFTRMVRMGIVGIFSAVLLIGLRLILRGSLLAAGADYLLMVVLPYLASAFGAMLIARKWHSRENLLGILAVSLFNSVLPFVMHSMRENGQLPDGILLALTGLIFMAVIRECVLYVKESEISVWNFC